ncbi:MAG: NAD(P)-dependent dehydrogenase (short-subunit alcohol dehydrogenase family) [Acidimicrobiales bacterium]|jgi:NAD(P)-dependent dehydrogenase (short-subunit alcohol dehydrogenase family)
MTTNQVAILCGGGSQLADGIGNGKAAAILLARDGASVVVVDRKLEAAQHTVDAIEAEGGTALAFEADVTNADDCQAMVATTLDAFGSPTILVNNVGIGSRGSVVESSLEDWERVMRVNVTSMMLTSKYTIPAMETSGGGAIVNLSSISALRPRNLTAYSTSKGAVIALTKAMAVDHAPQGIRVNCVAPGPVYTPMVYAAGMSDDAREQRRKASLLQIEGTGWDVGNAVAFLASDKARYITGQTLVVDGGVTLKGPGRDPGTDQ